MEQIPPEKTYRLLESGPVVLVVTRDHRGRANVMTMGFHMVVHHAPARIAGIIGPWDASYQALEETEQCVVAVPTIDIAEVVVDIGNCSGDTVDKLERFGLATASASVVKPPLLLDCVANLECRVADRSLVASHSLWVFDVIALWYDRGREEKRTLHHRGDGTFGVFGETIDLKDRMVLWKSFQVDL